MKLDQLNTWLSLGANFGVLIGIYFLVVEIQLSNSGAIQNRAISVIENVRATNQLFIENAEIWTRAKNGETLNHAEHEVYDRIIASMWSSRYQGNIVAYEQEDFRNVGLHDFAGILHADPVARQHWLHLMDDEQYYRNILVPTPSGVEFMEIVKQDLEFLDQSIPTSSRPN